MTVIDPHTAISLFVKNIYVFEEKADNQKTVLPFFADGYPGLMFQETKNGLFVSPHNKEMPQLFLYGQTIYPIELHIEGPYKLIAFQLYPFVLKQFFNVTAKDINDNCYDLTTQQSGASLAAALLRYTTLKKKVNAISDMLAAKFTGKKEMIDFTISKAIEMILKHSNKISMAELCKNIHLTQRTFERRFIDEVGIPPKQFSKIIQFQQSFQQLTLKEYKNLTDIVYSNGYADQSHFIRVFKAYTGRTPKNFRLA